MEKKISKYIYEQVAKHNLSQQDAKDMLVELKEISNISRDGIAVIGIACKLPGAQDIDEYWRNLEEGNQCISQFPENRKKDTEIMFSNSVMNFLAGKSIPEEEQEKDYSVGGYLKEIDKFDAGFFRISPKESQYMDPYQRMILETSWESIEDAGYSSDDIYGTRTGVFIGRDYTPVSIYKYLAKPDPMNLTGSWTGIMASRISYIFNLKGPSMVVDTACSSGLVSIHKACESLYLKECDMAIAGGINLNSTPLKSVSEAFDMVIVESKDGKLRPFDKSASGTIWGEGVCTVLLKPLAKAIEDGDNIHAVIKGSAINNDGASNGITAPNAEAQEDVILRAWKQANINPETISYTEAHGTGTVLGDPIEIKGLMNAFRKYTDRKQFCAIGSVKPSIGHTVATSGVAGMIKVILSMKNKKIPATLNFQEPNPYINFSESPVYVNDKLREWKKEDTPRRAGVSSFAFSGTNCYVVLEEAPQIPKSFINNSIYKERIITLSAKKESVLKELIQRYDTFLKNVDKEQFDDICYTANVGRGHYNCRLAIICSSLDDLRGKVRELLKKDFKTDEANGIYYGEFRVVSENKKDIVEGEVIESEIKKGSAIFNKRIENNFTDDSGIDDLMIEICKNYTKGMDISWKKIYEGQKRVRVSIPVYPLERVRYWADVKDFDLYESKKNPRKIHTLVEKHVCDSVNERIYSTILSPEKDWILKEHRLLEHYVVPGTACLEIALEAYQRLSNNNEFELRDATFLTPVVVNSGEEKEIRIILRKEKDYFVFNIVSQSTKDYYKEDDIEMISNWVLHAQGEFHKVDKHEIQGFSIEELKQKCGLKIESMDENTSSGAFQLGRRWLNVKKKYMGSNALIAELELLDEYKVEVKDFIIHPALMDNAVNVISQNLSEGIHLPFTYKKMRIYGALPSKIYSYQEILNDGSNATGIIELNAKILDEKGKVIAEVENYMLKRINENDIRLESNSNIQYFDLRWVEEKANDNRNKTIDGSILVFCDEIGLSRKLIPLFKTLKENIIEIEIGKKFNIKDYNHFMIEDNEDSYQQLFSMLKDRNISEIVHLTSLQGNNSIDTINDLDKSQKMGIMSVFYIVRAIYNNNIQRNINITLITDCANEITGNELVINPQNASLCGLAKVIRSEVSNLNCKCIDIDSTVELNEIINEINSTEENGVIALRNNKRYSEELGIIDIDKYQLNDITFKDGAVYIVTGGAGGIGLEYTKYLASKCKAKIVVLNRSSMPEKKYWDKILFDNNNTKLCNKINTIKEIEETGSEIIQYSVDVSDFDKMKDILNEIRDKYKRIDGVIHCAGVPGEGLIVKKDINKFIEVIRPKILGTWVLDELTDKDDLDFFIMISSIGSFIGGVGQGDYTAANAYLDSFAKLRSRKGRRTLTIDWPTWKDVGMAVENNSNFDVGVFKAISTKKAMSSFEEVFMRDINRVVISELNLEGKIVDQVGNQTFKFNNEIMSKFKKKVAKSDADATRDVALNGRASNEYTPLEKRLACIWGEVLGLDEISIYDNFYEIGGDSIQAIKITNEINKDIVEKISMNDVFENTTIEALATHIDKHQSSEVTALIESNEVEKTYEDHKEEVFDLSHAQQRIWFLQKLEPEMFAYNLSTKVDIHDEIDLAALNIAVNIMLKRHSSLRTIFIEDNGIPKQMILESANLEVKYEDISSNEDSRELLGELVYKLNKLPFDLEKLLIRVILFKVKEKEYCFYCGIHHIVIDGWSFSAIMDELMEVYRICTLGNRVDSREIGPRYSNFVTSQKEWFNSDECIDMEKYWTNELSKPLPNLNLPTDFPYPQTQTYNGNFIKYTLDFETAQRVKNVSSKLNLTTNMLLLSSYFLFLNKITKDNDIIISTPVLGRDDKSLENMVGLLINSICIRINFSGIESFRDLANVVKEKTLNGYKNSKYPFDMLVTKINPERNLTRNVIFQTSFKFYKQFHTQSNNISQFEISLLCEEKEDKINFTIEYNTDLFRDETIERFSKYFIHILENLQYNLDIPLKEFNIIPQKEKKLLLEDFNKTKIDYENYKTVSELFEEQVYKTPSNVALVYKTKQLTYSELNTKSNGLAMVLREKGVKPDDIVGIMVRRSPEMIIAILAILKAGGAYLPIDPDYPSERINYMLEDSGTNVLLTQDGLDSKVDFNGQCIDLFREESYGYADFGNLEVVNNPKNIAYVIYTSGSTGKPKGVMIEHMAVNNFIKGITDIIDFRSEKTILNLTTISFDIFVLESLLPLISGVKVVIADEEEQMDATLIDKLIVKNRIDMIQATPSRIKLLIESGSKLNCFRYLKEIMIGGEALQYELLKQIKSVYDGKIFNMYGPTETTVWSMVKELTNTDNITIGKPIANTQIYILDEENKLQPIGVSGELCIGGDGLARGYFNRKNLTDEKFMESPFEKGKRIYKTGDLAKWLPNGEVEFLGRMDQQVKIRGYRIELGEIETILSQHNGIKECVVTARDSKEGYKYLVAYYMSYEEIGVSELRDYISRELPSYMIPAYFVRLEKMPLTPNGKIDRKSLPEPIKDENSHFINYKEATTEIEKNLVSIWKSLLGREQVGVNDNFFELGGNSLLLARMQLRIDELYPSKVKIADIFSYSTIAKLSEFINKKEPDIKKRVEIESIKLPKEYFIEEHEENEDTLIQFTIDKETVNIILDIAQDNKVKLEDVLLSIYIYELNCMSDQENITVQTFLEGINGVFALSIDISKLAEIEELFINVNNIRRGITASQIYEVDNIDKLVNSEECSMIPMFTNRKCNVEKLLGLYDLVVRVQEGEDITFNFEYNASNLRNHKIKDMAYHFRELLKTIVLERMK
ncbi:non-ribosomal peptide synthetase [Clostridium sp. C8-1-8]|uniref:non-ribosomal peptide synthetase n=1 Tax=Clostridium sp. C8-1-8 TaxID=2698831 RepID=UPI001371DB77|nr:non-ribosomal peptide synthetase [Clostridium sp. C8-1-8]